MTIEDTASRKTYELQKSFLEYIQTLWITNVLVQFVPFNNRRRERGNLKKSCFNLNRGTLLVFVILFVLTEVGLIGTLDVGISKF